MIHNKNILLTSYIIVLFTYHVSFQFTYIQTCLSRIKSIKYLYKKGISKRMTDENMKCVALYSKNERDIHRAHRNGNERDVGDIEVEETPNL